MDCAIAINRKINFRFFIAALFSLIFLFADNLNFIKGELSRGQIIGRDFLQFWTASSLISQEKYNDIYDFSAFTNHAPENIQKSGATFNFLYPPHALALILPLSKISYVQSLILWTVTGLIIYMVVGGIRPSNSNNIWLALLLAPTTILNITSGQSGLFLSALLVGGLLCLNKYPRISGFLFGILTVKPQLGLLIPIALIAGNHKRAFNWAILSTLSFFCISFFLCGSGIWISWIENKPWIYAKNWIEFGKGLGIFMQPSPFISLRILSGSIDIAWVAQFISGLFAAICVALVFKKSNDTELKYSVLIISTYLASPYIHCYDMAAMSIVVIWLVKRGMNSRFEYGELLLLTLAWIMPLATIFISCLGLPLAPLFLIIFLFFVCKKALLHNPIDLNQKN